MSAMVSSISNEENGLVTVVDDTRHGLETGDFVTFTELGVRLSVCGDVEGTVAALTLLQGMDELNECEPVEVKVLGPYTFTIGDT